MFWRGSLPRYAMKKRPAAASQWRRTLPSTDHGRPMLCVSHRINQRLSTQLLSTHIPACIRLEKLLCCGLFLTWQARMQQRSVPVRRLTQS